MTTDTAEDTTGFVDGAVVFIDALGFKGIWARPDVRKDPLIVLHKLRVLARALPSFLVKDLLVVKWTEPSKEALRSVSDQIRLAFLSDTVVIGVSTGIKDAFVAAFGDFEDDIAAGPFAVLCACVLTQLVVGRMGDEPVPLAMRGCISRGRFAIVDRFVLGPAVDEAAEAADLAEAAIVWLLPSASEELLPAMRHAHTIVMPYRVPLKQGATLTAPCVIPFYELKSDKERLAHCERVLRTFDSRRLDVCVKREHTESFLEACERELERRFQEEYGGAGPPKP